MSGLTLPNYNLDCVPSEVIDYPGMTTPREKGMLFWLAKNAFEGKGLIVDAGLFLGASTNAFAMGIKANPKVSSQMLDGYKPINSYDIAIWVKSMDRYLETEAAKQVLNGRTINHGENFSPILRGLLAPHLDLVDFRIGDIVKLASADRPVEIAFYDCLKTPDREAAAFHAFAPKYIPGKTIVVQQDYFYESAIALKIRQEFLASYFEYLGAEATSAVFRLRDPIPAEYFEKDPIEELSLESKVSLLFQAANRSTESKFKVFGQLAVVELLVDAGESDRALRTLDEIEAEATQQMPNGFGPRLQSTFSGLRKLLLGRME